MEKKQKTITVWIASDNSEHLSEFNALEHERKLAEVKAQSRLQDMIDATNKLVDDAIRSGTHTPWPWEKIGRAITFQEGVDLWWWPSFDDRGPHPWPWVFQIDLGVLTRFDPLNDSEIRCEFTEKERTFGHILNKIGAFDSIGDAKRNGWSKPIQSGDFWFKKKSIHLIVVNTFEISNKSVKNQVKHK